MSRSSLAKVCLLLASLLVAAGMCELLLRVVQPQAALLASPLLEQSAHYGWDSVPEMTSLQDRDTGPPVYFVGDSFTQGAQWPKRVAHGLQAQGTAIAGYELGVSGFGTVQEYAKVARTFAAKKPSVVVLLFFAWNDLRDNYDQPAIAYGPQTRHRLYWNGDSPAPELLPPPAPGAWERLRLFQLWVRCEDHLGRWVARGSGIDAVAQLPLQLNYAAPVTWLPFYQKLATPPRYREAAWQATEHAFAALQQFLAARQSQLLVVGIDNAFTVDADVYQAHLQGVPQVDVGQPLARLSAAMKRLRIPYVDGAEALRALARQSRQKVYIGPAGNLSGHLTPPGEAALADVIVPRLRELLGHGAAKAGDGHTR